MSEILSKMLCIAFGRDEFFQNICQVSLCFQMLQFVFWFDSFWIQNHHCGFGTQKVVYHCQSDLTVNGLLFLAVNSVWRFQWFKQNFKTLLIGIMIYFFFQQRMIKIESLNWKRSCLVKQRIFFNEVLNQMTWLLLFE